MGFPSITAHTGCEGTAANTLESALRGLSAGADFVEVDVRATKDGVAVLSHDDAARGESAITISQTTSTDLERRSPDIQFLEPLLAEIIQRGGGLNLDIKDDQCIHPVCTLIDIYNVSGKIVITGCAEPRVRKFRKSAPDIPVYLNTDFCSSSDDALKNAYNLGCCGINIDYHLFTPALVANAHAAGLLVSIWTVPGKAGFGEFIAAGVDNITTREPAALALLRKGPDSAL